MTQKRLTQKQYNFVNNYIKNGFNATQAALDAGYSPKYADAQSYKLLNHSAISQHLSLAYKNAEHSTEITFQWKLEKLKKVILRFENSPLAQDQRVLIAAISELNKMTGEYAPNKKVSLTIEATKQRLDEARRMYENDPQPRKYDEY